MSFKKLPPCIFYKIVKYLKIRETKRLKLTCNLFYERLRKIAKYCGNYKLRWNSYETMLNDSYAFKNPHLLPQAIIINSGTYVWSHLDLYVPRKIMVTGRYLINCIKRKDKGALKYNINHPLFKKDNFIKLLDNDKLNLGRSKINFTIRILLEKNITKWLLLELIKYSVSPQIEMKYIDLWWTVNNSSEMDDYHLDTFITILRFMKHGRITRPEAWFNPDASNIRYEYLKMYYDVLSDKKNLYRCRKYTIKIILGVFIIIGIFAIIGAIIISTPSGESD
jgi:hypothetical protein